MKEENNRRMPDCLPGALPPAAGEKARRLEDTIDL